MIEDNICSKIYVILCGIIYRQINDLLYNFWASLRFVVHVWANQRLSVQCLGKAMICGTFGKMVDKMVEKQTGPLTKTATRRI